MNPELIVNDVTQLNPVPVWAIATPTSIDEVQEALRRTTGPISVGGGHFSMGGQTASPGSLHLDMRKFNRVLSFQPQEKLLRVQAGIRWCDIQKFVDPHGLSVKIMQTYANFTVGGSLSVNVHGRYMGLGPLILSVRAIKLVLANTDIVDATPTHNAHLFYAAIGGYCAIGVIVEAELELADNARVARQAVKMPMAAYHGWFKKNVRDAQGAVFHNADIYAPHYSKVRAVSWFETKHPVTVPHSLQPHRRAYPLQNYFLWAVSETPFGKWRREYLIDPLLYLSKPVHWRNYEAGYDVAELEPPSRKHRTYVLQEYFIPVEKQAEFIPKMAEILQRHRVNVLNISIRHARPDPGSLLAWARSETFAFVLYYKQRTRVNARNRVAVWTRELIDAALEVGGSYYLPYQPHATPEQFHRAYPRAHELFALKRELDPDYRLRNVLWDKYYAPTLHPSPGKTMPNSDFHVVYDDVSWQDKFYLFLQNIYHLYPEDRFHTLIIEATAKHQDDEAIYRCIQDRLPTIKPFLSELTYALPALAKQKKEITRQTLQLLGDKRSIDGYVEIGSPGRYLSHLRKALKITGDIVLINETEPSNSPVDIVERGGLTKLGRYVPLNDYEPIPASAIADASVELVTVYIGLHHIAPDKLAAYIASLHRILKPGSLLILRDHDVTHPEMFAFVSLAHAVFNAGLGAPWENNAAELRHFVSVDEWVNRLEAAGFKDNGQRILQAHDPSLNVLMAFTKVA
ncbi:FAD-binding protein [Andreprevotia chitinilytica]|uniref:FAD-binding protein n=1 Tax=Andreprevotia chitinilytica TaxID=396808 RepID=UPI0005572D07|nr:FAD-binding protein [Andreprevotia chitinilytica]